MNTERVGFIGGDGTRLMIFSPLFRSNFLVTPRGYLARHEDLTGRVTRRVVGVNYMWGKLKWGQNVGSVRG